MSCPATASGDRAAVGESKGWRYLAVSIEGEEPIILRLAQSEEDSLEILKEEPPGISWRPAR